MAVERPVAYHELGFHPCPMCPNMEPPPPGWPTRKPYPGPATDAMPIPRKAPEAPIQPPQPKTPVT